jgi:hypothetical protein
MISRDGDTFVADARASLEEASEALRVDLAIGDMAEEVDTLGGLIVTLAGRVPSRGELIAGPEHLEFEVLDADPRRVKRLRIHRRDNGEARPEAVPARVEPRPAFLSPAGRDAAASAGTGEAIAEPALSSREASPAEAVTEATARSA